MNRLLSVIKNLLHTTFSSVVIVSVFIYIFIHFNIAGQIANHNLIEKLSDKLNARIEAQETEITWLNQIAINHFVMYDQQGDTMLYARRVMVAYELLPLLRKELVLNTIQLIDFNFSIRKKDIHSEANYEFLIEALAPRQADRQRRFINDINISALLLRNGTITYDIENCPRNDNPLIIDKDHIEISDISASLQVNISHIKGLDVWLKRLSFNEKYGISVPNCHFRVFADNGIINVEDLILDATKQFQEGPKCIFSTNLNTTYQNGYVTADISKLHVSADTCFAADANVKASINVSNPDSTSIQTQIYSSHIATSTLINIIEKTGKSDAFAFLYNYDDSVKSIYGNGNLAIIGKESASFKGKIGLDGLISGFFDCDLDFCEKLTARMNGRFSSFPFNGYTYRNLNLRADYGNDNLNARFDINDQFLNADGKIDIKQRKKESDISLFADIRRINPYELHLTTLQNLEDMKIRSIVKGSMKICNNDKSSFISQIPTGHLKLDSVCLRNKIDTLRLDPFNLNIQMENETPIAVLKSPLMNVVATPSAAIGIIPAHQRFARMLSMGAVLSEPANFTAEWDSTECTIQLEANFPSIIYNEARINASFSANGTTNEGNPIPNYLTTRINLGYLSDKHHLQTRMRAAIEPDPLYVTIEPSTISIDGKSFETTGAQLIKEDDGSFLLQDLKIHDNEQQLDISGYLSTQKDIDLLLQTNNFQTDFFFDMLGKRYLDFGGYATGDIIISSDSVMHLRTDSLLIDRFTYIGYPLGKHFVTCNYNLEDSRLMIESDIKTDSIHNTHTNCDIYLGKEDSLDLRFNTDHLPVDFVSNWVGGILQDLHGYGSGNVRLYGKFSNLNLVGDPVLDGVSFTHDLLGARFNISDTLHLSTDDTETTGFIGLTNARIKDSYGQEALVTVDLVHHNFSGIEYGVDIDIPETESGFLIFDHPQQQNTELYWGRIWATGRCQMHGLGNNHKINLQMETAGRSVFNLSPGEESFSENRYSFLTFRDKRFVGIEMDNHDTNTATSYSDKNRDESSYIDADLQIHANENCQVYVQMDPLAEDRMICKGNGDIALHYDPFHDITLTGNYDINQGSYTVNLKGDLMTKAFILQEGSHIAFTGVPSDAELKLNAVYNIPSVNLKDLDESFASLSSMSRTTLPVDCKLFVNGQLTSPQISFDLEVKNTSDDVQALVHNIIGTQEMLNREVFYLLLFSKFYTPEYASTSQRQSGSELTSFASSSLTSQLNNLLGHISDNFTLGTNFRTDKGDFSDMEMDVSLSTRLLNNRLLLNGNLGYRDPANRIGMANNTNSFIGDFDVEFLINRSGTFRAKAYSHYNDRDYSINNALTTQGAGIILRKDFKHLKELIQWHH